MGNKLSFKKRISACFTLLFSSSLPSWWWSDLSDEFYESKIVHDYKDGKFDYRAIRAWFLKQRPQKIKKAKDESYMPGNNYATHGKGLNRLKDKRFGYGITWTDEI